MKIRLNSSPCDAPCCMKLELVIPPEEAEQYAKDCGWVKPTEADLDSNPCVCPPGLTYSGCRSCHSPELAETAAEFLKRSDDLTSRLIQTDYDYPSLAGTFGWNIRTVQLWKRDVEDSPPFSWYAQGVYGCSQCRLVFKHDETEDNGVKDGTDKVDRYCPECGEEVQIIHFTPCDHSSTDGTVDCSCGVTASQFIAAAGEWLRNNDGAEADDPGYFA